jgi:hypothetical protein
VDRDAALVLEIQIIFLIGCSKESRMRLDDLPNFYHSILPYENIGHAAS